MITLKKGVCSKIMDETKKDPIYDHLKEIKLQFTGTHDDGYLLFGLNVADNIGSIAKKWGKNVLIITDKTMVSLGTHKVITTSLFKQKIKYEIFDGVLAEPHVEVMEEALAFAKKGNFDVIVGLGGGSCLDTAKPLL